MMKYFLPIFVLVFVTLSFADDFDIFNEIEVKEPKAVETKDKKFTDILLSGMDFNLVFKYYHFLSNFEDKTGEKDKRKDFANIMFEPKLKYSIKNTIFNFRGWLEYGNEKDTYKGIGDEFTDNSRYRRYAQLAEINTISSFGNLELTLGKKVIRVGVSSLYSPADRFKVVEGNDPIDLKEIGLWQIRTDYFQKNTNYTFVFLPAYNESKVPSQVTRWSGETDNESSSTEFDGVSEKDINKEIVNVTPKNFSYLGRVKTTLKGWDLFLSAYYGVSPYSVLKKDQDNSNKYYREHPMIISSSAGFSTTYKKFEFHGEGYAQHSPQGKDDDFFNYVVGSTYTLDEWVQYIWLDRIDATIEYAGELVINKQYAEYYERSSQDQRAGRNNILGRFNAKVNEKLNFEWYFTRSFDDSGYMHHYGATYKFNKGVNVKAFFDFFDGPKDSYYGRWRKNDRFMTFVEYKF
ncbi:hypothetical protein Calni_0504 [Calditerrivibrio nitroreducens DSM 19672]|uniref:Alginate export domain-containing protein n=2 Tax=Calditerrivibrio nitroreducens TaxID=477976 RepID=E4TF78_CALNY|nr:hypothetical protein Calni_0504 [Calditerrivibrio nitroreducens DSM 19672]